MILPSISLKESRKPILRTYRDLENRGGSTSTLAPITYATLYFHNGDVDGGDLDGCSEAMDYLDSILDGGQM